KKGSRSPGGHCGGRVSGWGLLSSQRRQSGSRQPHGTAGGPVSFIQRCRRGAVGNGGFLRKNGWQEPSLQERRGGGIHPHRARLSAWQSSGRRQKEADGPGGARSGGRSGRVGPHEV